MKKLVKYLLVATGLCAFLGLAPLSVHSAFAQASGGVEVLEALVIEGKLQKPEVFYILSRHKSKYRALKLRRSFLKEIRNTLKKNPF